MSFRFVPKSVTLNVLERRNDLYFALFHRFRVRCRRKIIIRSNSVSKSTFESKVDFETELGLIIILKSFDSLWPY